MFRHLFFPVFVVIQSCRATVFKSSLISSDVDSLFGQKNRCLFYPRCLLFQCCPLNLMSSIEAYFLLLYDEKDSSPRDRGSFEARLKSISFFNITITHDIVNERLSNLPPTPPWAYEKLKDTTGFRVLYLMQGEARNNTETCVVQIEDMIFLSYKQKHLGKGASRLVKFPLLQLSLLFLKI